MLFRFFGSPPVGVDSKSWVLLLTMLLSMAFRLRRTGFAGASSLAPPGLPSMVARLLGLQTLCQFLCEFSPSEAKQVLDSCFGDSYRGAMNAQVLFLETKQIAQS